MVGHTVAGFGRMAVAHRVAVGWAAYPDIGSAGNSPAQVLLLEASARRRVGYHRAGPGRPGQAQTPEAWAEPGQVPEA